MSDTQSIQTEFQAHAKTHVDALREILCSLSGRMADAMGDIDRADDVRQEMVNVICAALLEPGGAPIEYDMNVLPQWVFDATHRYAPRGGA